MEILTILLIFSLGVIMLLGCFLGGIMFVFKVARKMLDKLFGRSSKN